MERNAFHENMLHRIKGCPFFIWCQVSWQRTCTLSSSQRVASSAYQSLFYMYCKFLPLMPFYPMSFRPSSPLVKIKFAITLISLPPWCGTISFLHPSSWPHIILYISNIFSAQGIPKGIISNFTHIFPWRKLFWFKQHTCESLISPLWGSCILYRKLIEIWCGWFFIQFQPNFPYILEIS